jgi:hypothetical protein
MREYRESPMFLDGNIENHSELRLNILQADKTHTGALKRPVPAHVVLGM